MLVYKRCSNLASSKLSHWPKYGHAKGLQTAGLQTVGLQTSDLLTTRHGCKPAYTARFPLVWRVYQTPCTRIAIWSQSRLWRSSSLWSHFGVTLESLWSHFGVTLKSLRSHFGVQSWKRRFIKLTLIWPDDRMAAVSRNSRRPNININLFLSNFKMEENFIIERIH